MKNKHYAKLKFGSLQWMNEPFSIYKSMAMTQGNAEVNFFFFLVLSNETFSLSFFSPCQLSLCLGIECDPQDFAAGSLPFLHRTTVTTAQSVLCKAAIVWGWCSLRVLVQYMPSCLGPWPPFLSWLWKPLFSRYKGEQNTQQNGGGVEGRLQRESVYPGRMDQQPT